MTTWTINTLDTYPTAQGNADVVHRIHWGCSATHNEHSANVINVAGLEYAGGSFTSFEELTKEQVLEWLWSVVDKATVEDAVNQMLMAKVDPVSVTKSVPWSE
jgi:hypothetical protein